MLVLLDGFKCHIAEETKALCLVNNIVVMVFPPHTAHATRWHLFYIYKTAHRNRNTTRSVVSVSKIEGLPYATSKRRATVAKSLVFTRSSRSKLSSTHLRKQEFSQSRLITSSPTTKRYVIPRRRCSRALALRCKRTWEYSVANKKGQRLSSRVSSIIATER
jgi:hypothetical protein